MKTMLSQLMAEFYAHSGATERGVCKAVHIGPHTVVKCLRGETYM